ncbi:MAG: plasma-membrane proton-efflux P-type ATPase [Calditrichia bacterium]
MEATIIQSEEAQKESKEELFKHLSTGPQGLSSEEVQKRLAQYGPNALKEEKENPILKFLSYFWGPIPWMIEVAAVLSLVVQHWTDFIIIVVLLVFNAVVGFWQEFQASNALEALKNELALKARVLRDGKWQEIAAEELVPGDIIRLRLGDIVPADVKLTDGDYLMVDQSALTGESLPVEKKVNDLAYSGSTIKQGEMVSLVTATGENTYFARTAKLVESAGAVSHFQKAVLTIGDYLIYISLGLATFLVLAQLVRGDHFLTIFQFVLILVVAAIPVAMPAVLSVTMALGALTLSHMKAIVSRLQSIEEIAGIDILCSDKTGTLTQNKLTLGDPVTFRAKDNQELILAGALASKEEDRDAIDQAVINALSNPEILKSYQQLKFVPFDPNSKRTEATVKDKKGSSLVVTKGAPQVIMGMCKLTKKDKSNAEKIVDDFATKGYRTLGVARAEKEDGPWEFLGMLPLYDPPREDSKETIQRAEEHGIQVKMVTGDNVAIGREISKQLGLKSDIQPADKIFTEDEDLENLSCRAISRIEKADGFAQVFPEHKYDIVKVLQGRGHLVAMTGDGVNDAPALKQADVGVAVSGATNAAQAAASLVLTAPGLSVIIRAVEEARRIFERMNSYAIYRITETIRIMFFVVLAMIVFNFYPITTVMIILLALLNDLPIMTIAYDNTWLDPKPVKWNMRRVITVATVLGLIGVAETFGLLLIGKMLFKMEGPPLQSLIYLKLAVAGHMTLFVVRSRKSFVTSPYPATILLVAIFATQGVAAMIVGFGFLMAKIPWSYVGFIWGYCIVWAFIEDWAKLHVYKHLELRAGHHRKFLGKVQTSLHSHAGA